MMTRKRIGIVAALAALVAAVAVGWSGAASSKAAARHAAAATDVSFGGVDAHFRIVNDSKLTATVPQRAKSGPIFVTSALKQVKSRASFRVLAAG